MSSDIFYDRLIGPTTTSSGSDQTTTTLTVTSETAPTAVHAFNYGNFIVQVSSPGDTGPVLPATCTDTQGSSYTLVKEVLFSGFALDIFSRISTTPNVSTTVTVSHQPSKHRIILCDEWYNLGSFEKKSSAYSATANALTDLAEFHVGAKHWLVYSVLAIGGSSHGDAVTIPDDWNLLHDVGTNYGDGEDVRLVIAYQIANKRKKVDFRPTIGTARVWGSVMFAYKAKI